MPKHDFLRQFYSFREDAAVTIITADGKTYSQRWPDMKIQARWVRIENEQTIRVPYEQIKQTFS